MRPRSAALVGAILFAAILTACSSTGDQAGGTTATESTAPACPTEPVRIVVSVDQWGSIVGPLADACADVTTVITGADVDPHDYEPSVADIAAFDSADLVVVNGVDYDHWAEDAAGNAASDPIVIDAGEVTHTGEGEDPHLWYSPELVDQVAAAITAELSTLRPDAGDYFDARAAAWQDDLAPYTALIADIRAEHADAPIAATEPVFTRMAEALGLVDVTPPGYVAAAGNESDPAPGEVAAFDQLLSTRAADALIYNTQTEGAIPEQLRRAAEDQGIPVVEVTESVPSDAGGFAQWQVAQLESLRQALAG